jgi:hypothetical protein
MPSRKTIAAEVIITLCIAAGAYIGISYAKGNHALQEVFGWSESTKKANIPENRGIEKINKLQQETLDAVVGFLESDSAGCISHNMVIVYSLEEKRSFAGVMLTKDGLFLTTMNATTDASGKDFSGIYVIENGGNTYQANGEKVNFKIMAKDTANQLALIYAPISSDKGPSAISLYHGELTGKNATLCLANGNTSLMRSGKIIQTGITNLIPGDGDDFFKLAQENPLEDAKSGIVAIDDMLGGITQYELFEKNEKRLIAAGPGPIERLLRVAVEYSKQ